MKKLLAVTALLASAATASFAGSYTEPPVDPYVPPPPAPVTFNWTGGYAGIGIGAMRQRDTAELADRVLAPSDGAQLSALIGYNWQGAGAFVLGAEAMVAGGRVRGNEPCSNPAFDCATRVGSTAALRLRVGVASDRTLFFVTAGVARMSVTHSTERQPVPGLTEMTVGRNAATASIGIEHAMMNGWNIRGEVEGYRLRRGTYTLDSNINYSASRGTATAARLTLVRRF